MNYKQYLNFFSNIMADNNQSNIFTISSVFGENYDVRESTTYYVIESEVLPLKPYKRIIKGLLK